MKYFFFLAILSFFSCNAEHPTPEDDTSPVMPVDADGDGYLSTEDCDDDDRGSYPGAMEICDGKDNDCDDEIDEGVTETFYADSDRDGYGNPEVTTEGCISTEGWTENALDCDDGNAAVHPGATEVCRDRIDNDCDSLIDRDDPECP